MIRRILNWVKEENEYKKRNFKEKISEIKQHTMKMKLYIATLPCHDIRWYSVVLGVWESEQVQNKYIII